MSYTIGIKRRFIPGYRKVMVNGHDWQNFRFILNLTDGSQEYVPGFSISTLKVYPDFWTHLAQIERSHAGQMVAPPPNVPRETAPIEPPPGTRFVSPEDYIAVQEPGPVESADMQEVRRRAAERVRDILASHPH